MTSPATLTPGATFGLWFEAWKGEGTTAAWHSPPSCNREKRTRASLRRRWLQRTGVSWSEARIHCVGVSLRGTMGSCCLLRDLGQGYCGTWTEQSVEAGLSKCSALRLPCGLPEDLLFGPYPPWNRRSSQGRGEEAGRSAYCDTVLPWRRLSCGGCTA